MCRTFCNILRRDRLQHIYNVVAAVQAMVVPAMVGIIVVIGAFSVTSLRQ